ncbi:hypothetical protein NDI37_17675 [Funiculus sociatus GB2-A5]|uniref:Uncharacterized protein n=1 Tax=Funiculus sociatus GB2-A5 TaxID=2933946 RepID=A0ABV0JSB0_9CYAN|nr:MULTISPECIES: hypothetical protein [unclassified Trichocoleus]
MVAFKLKGFNDTAKAATGWRMQSFNFAENLFWIRYLPSAGNKRPLKARRLKPRCRFHPPDKSWWPLASISFMKNQVYIYIIVLRFLKKPSTSGMGLVVYVN